MRSLGTDFRQALCRLLTTPLFTLFAVVTLALGIGATTAIYAAVEALLRPPRSLRRGTIFGVIATYMSWL